PGSVLQTDRTSGRPNPDALTTDVARFEEALRQAARAAVSDGARAAVWEQAVKPSQRALLPGFYDETTDPQAPRLNTRLQQSVGPARRPCRAGLAARRARAAGGRRRAAGRRRRPREGRGGVARGAGARRIRGALGAVPGRLAGGAAVAGRGRGSSPRGASA